MGDSAAEWRTGLVQLQKRLAPDVFEEIIVLVLWLNQFACTCSPALRDAVFFPRALWEDGAHEEDMTFYFQSDDDRKMIQHLLKEHSCPLLDRPLTHCELRLTAAAEAPLRDPFSTKNNAFFNWSSMCEMSSPFRRLLPSDVVVLVEDFPAHMKTINKRIRSHSQYVLFPGTQRAADAGAGVGSSPSITFPTSVPAPPDATRAIGFGPTPGTSDFHLPFVSRDFAACTSLGASGPGPCVTFGDSFPAAAVSEASAGAAAQAEEVQLLRNADSFPTLQLRYTVSTTCQEEAVAAIEGAVTACRRQFLCHPYAHLYKKQSNEGQRAEVICKGRLSSAADAECCLFNLRVLRLANGNVEVTKSQLQHTCTALPKLKRKHHGVKLPHKALVGMTQHLVRAEPNISIEALRAEIVQKESFTTHSLAHVGLDYQRLWRTRAKAAQVASDSDLSDVEAFARRMCDVDANTRVALDVRTTPDGPLYNYIIISPGPARMLSICPLLRPKLAVDAAFCKPKENGYVFSVLGYGPDNEVIPLVTGHFVSPESNESWGQLLRFLGHHLPEFCRRSIHVITDQNPALAATIHSVFPHWYHALCAQHRAALPGLKEHSNAIFELARCTSTYVFDKVLLKHFRTLDKVPDKLLDHVHQWSLAHMCLNSEEAVQHYRDCKHPECEFSAAWVAARFDSSMEIALRREPPRLQGPFANPESSKASQLAESWNSMIVEDRRQPVSQLIKSLHSRMLQIYAGKRDEYNCRQQEIPPRLTQDINAVMATVVAGPVEFCSEHAARVFFSSDTNALAVVNLRLRTCTCRAWQTRCILCKHAITVIIAKKFSIMDYIPAQRTTAGARQLFAAMGEIVPAHTHDLDLCEPALRMGTKSTGAGRKRLKRLTPGKGVRRRPVARAVAVPRVGTGERGEEDDSQQRKQCCSFCGHAGHRSDKCPVASLPTEERFRAFASGKPYVVRSIPSDDAHSPSAAASSAALPTAAIRAHENLTRLEPAVAGPTPTSALPTSAVPPPTPITSAPARAPLPPLQYRPIMASREQWTARKAAAGMPLSPAVLMVTHSSLAPPGAAAALSTASASLPSRPGSVPAACADPAAPAVQPVPAAQPAPATCTALAAPATPAARTASARPLGATAVALSANLANTNTAPLRAKRASKGRPAAAKRPTSKQAAEYILSDDAAQEGSEGQKETAAARPEARRRVAAKVDVDEWTAFETYLRDDSEVGIRACVAFDDAEKAAELKRSCDKKSLTLRVCGTDVSLESLKTLVDGVKLDDAVINAWMAKLQYRAVGPSARSDQTFVKTTFINSLAMENMVSAEREPPPLFARIIDNIVKNMRGSESELWVCPINSRVEDHWYLLVIDFGNQQFLVMDSICQAPVRISKHAGNFIATLRARLVGYACRAEAHGGLAPRIATIGDWPVIPVLVPHQVNLLDCGVHVIVLAERTAHIPRAARRADAWGNHRWHYSSEDIEISPYATTSMRLTLAWELVSGSLRRPVSYCEGSACTHWTLADRERLACATVGPAGAV